MLLRSFFALLASLPWMAYGSFAQAGSPNDPYRRILSQASPASVGVHLSPFAIVVPGPGDIYRGYGTYLIRKEEAALRREHVRWAKLETRRKTLEHWEYEREFFAGWLNRKLKREKLEELIRAVNHAPLTEIVSGTSLNVVLTALEPHKAKLASLRADPLPAPTVQAINTNFGAGGHLGLLKGGKVTWPVALTNRIYAPTCQRVDACVAQMYQRLLDSREVAGEDVRELSKLGSELEARHREEFRSARYDFDPFLEFRTIRNFVRQLEGAVSFLARNPKDAAFYLRPVEGKSAPEVAAYLIDNGLRVAPPTEGEGGERHYRVLHTEFVQLLKQLDPDAGVVPPAPRGPQP